MNGLSDDALIVLGELELAGTISLEPIYLAERLLDMGLSHSTFARVRAELISSGNAHLSPSGDALILGT